MNNNRRSNLKGWLASVRLSVLEETALARVPDIVLAGYCDELLGSRVPCALNSWYPERDIKAWGGLCPVGNTGYSRLAAHHLMLSDGVRMEAFDSAIRRAVRQGDVVVDIGTGTGVLALMACRAGAKRVYAVEKDEVAALAAEVAGSNGWGTVVNIIKGDAAQVEPSEPADVLVSECIGSVGVGTAQIASVLDSRRRWLRPGGIIIPQSVTVVVAPVESILTELYLRFWESMPGGFDYHAASAWARDQMYTVIVQPEELLATPSDVFKLRYDADHEYKGFEAQPTFSVCREGTVHGLALWFRADLFQGILLDTAPGLALTHWYQCFLPLRRGVAVDAGDILQVSIEHCYEDRDSVWEWSLQIGSTILPVARQTTSVRGARGAMR